MKISCSLFPTDELLNFLQTHFHKYLPYFGEWNTKGINVTSVIKGCSLY